MYPKNGNTGNTNNKMKKQFCKYKHDTFVCGRNKRGMCKVCEKESYKKWEISHIGIKSKKQFCPRGHDTWKVGRDKTGTCSICAVQKIHDRRDFLNKIKNKPCMDCEKMYNPWQMQFDHRPGTVKLFAISIDRYQPMDLLLTEIEKCDLVCGNCHANRSHVRLLQKFKRKGDEK